MSEQIPDKNLFMMCRKLNKNALARLSSRFHVRSCKEEELDTWKAIAKLASRFHIRNCREEELDIWKAMPFDGPKLDKECYEYMTKYFNEVYGKNKDLFYRKCLFVCDEKDVPIGTCFIWKAYGKINTVHWLKVLKNYEGNGIGRALLSEVMNELQEEDFPVFLHTQPSSYRAIKLYSDFGFEFLSDPMIGNRSNDLTECLPILEEYMLEKDFKKLKITEAPQYFLDAVNSSQVNEL